MLLRTGPVWLLHELLLEVLQLLSPGACSAACAPPGQLQQGRLVDWLGRLDDNNTRACPQLLHDAVCSVSTPTQTRVLLRRQQVMEGYAPDHCISESDAGTLTGTSSSRLSKCAGDTPRCKDNLLVRLPPCQRPPLCICRSIL
jgi:hypothetical protein